MKLVITEKPSVAKSIATVIGADKKADGYIKGNGYYVSWAVGHLVSMKEDKEKWDIEKLPIRASDELEIKEDTKKQFNILKQLMDGQDVDTIICATDAGREGELIFRYIYQAAGCKKPFLRLWISSMTDQSIKEGFENLSDGHNFDNLYKAAKARDIADYEIGISCTRLFTKKYNTSPVLSMGRVQTPTLYMIVKRDDDIKNFVKEEYFKVHVKTEKNGIVTDFTSENIKDKQKAMKLCEQLEDFETAMVRSVAEEEKYTPAPRLYDLTSLQRDCNKKYGYSAADTLATVQALYEKKLVTYPRTDSQYITDDMESEVTDLIDTVIKNTSFLTGITSDYEVKKCINNKKVSDHHAIIPTSEFYKESLSSDIEKNVLDLICLRLITATCRKQKYKSTKITVISDATAEEEYKATGKVVLDLGWKAAEDVFKTYSNAHRNNYVSESEEENSESTDEKELPEFAEGEILHITSDYTSHFTKPPKPFTEATLLTAMEKAGADEMNEDAERKGLGTPATRAAIIESLFKRGFCERNKKQIIPTKRGIDLISITPEKLTSPTLTADMENSLALISKGQVKADDFLNSMREYITDVVCSVKNTPITDNPFGNVSNLDIGNCPACNKPVKKGKYGYYCTGKCGMQIDKVYGYQLSDTQVKNLLSGKQVTYKNKGYVNTVESDIEAHDYNGTRRYQWKVTGKKEK